MNGLLYGAAGQSGNGRGSQKVTAFHGYPLS
jgi:hypothetical protein